MARAKHLSHQSGIMHAVGQSLAAFLVVLTLVVLAGPVRASAEPRVALIIGNSSYKLNRLKNPRNDAGLMARTLASMGFEVLTVMDGSADDMRRAVSDFGTRLQTPGAVALFYYAGHGVQIDGDNYLIPLGADIANSEDVAEFAVPLQSVMRTMARSGTRLNIVVLDACRDNPFSAGAWTASVTGLASVVAPADTIIAYATGPGELADDGIDGNSPYTAALVSEMLQPGATLEDVFRATRRHVRARTGNRQTPWEHSSLVSQFSFVPKATAESLVASASATTATDGFSELAAWDAIKTSQDPTLLQHHIDRFPNGLFAELAAVRLARLAALQSATPWSWMMTGGVDASERIATASLTYDKALMMDADYAPARDLAMAAKLYSEAASNGLPAAMYRLGRAYDKGRGVSRDQLEAARWFERAAAMNYAPAMAALGTMHEFGEGAAPDLAEALRLYRSAADAGDAAGMTSLAFLYSQGKGVARDMFEARRLYHAAADQANSRALYNLALMTLRGEGGPADAQAAIRLFQAAGDLGHAGALIELARMHDQGKGGARDAHRAATFVLKAARAAHHEGRAIDFTAFGWSFATRRQIQKQLTAEGLYKGVAHGFFTGATRDALIAVARR